MILENQQSGKDEIRFTEFVLLDEDPGVQPCAGTGLDKSCVQAK